MTAYDLAHHGDREVAPGLLDLAVNVRAATPPDWLLGRIERSMRRLGQYPDASRARDAVAARHGREPAEVLVTAGAAEAFVLLARALQPAHAVCVHPSFTEPELALRNAGHRVSRLVLEPPYRLEGVPDDADLVVLGNPTNPTGVLHEDLARLCRPGRVTVVDEAFMDAVPDERGSLASRGDLPGLVVVRSLTKTWALAGLRVGYLLAPADLVAELRRAQPLWAVSTPSLVALETCVAPGPVATAARDAAELAAERHRLVAGLRVLGVEVSAESQAPFVLCRVAGRPEVRDRLRDEGVAVRRGDTFPGLTAEHWRAAVRGVEATDALLAALARVLGASVPPESGTT